MEEETQISSSFYIEEDVAQPNHQERTKSLPGSSSSSSDLISRKISCAFSETDSGVDVESEEHAEDSFENSVEKKVIKPDHHVISRLCNFDEEDESSEDSSDNDTCVEEDDEDHAPAPVKCNPDRMTLSLVEVRHIMCALISEHIEASLECSIMGQIHVGRKCSVCYQNIFTMIVHSGYQCEVCSFIVCSHCSKQVPHLTEDQLFDLSVSSITPFSISQVTKKSLSTLSSLSVQDLYQDHNKSLSAVTSNLLTNVRRWSLGRKEALSTLCSTCHTIITQ